MCQKSGSIECSFCCHRLLSVPTISQLLVDVWRDASGLSSVPWTSIFINNLSAFDSVSCVCALNMFYYLLLVYGFLFNFKLCSFILSRLYLALAINRFKIGRASTSRLRFQYQSLHRSTVQWILSGVWLAKLSELPIRSMQRFSLP